MILSFLIFVAIQKDTSLLKLITSSSLIDIFPSEKKNLLKKSFELNKSPKVTFKESCSDS
ncbi:hypothetical protein BpHYR1_008652 [Brachionus plicatilis]|uniref:Uncharacterized protein n=1 Tax=Brachionus plicatilis TaxID=10195 RepID=A0A3M7TA06_BRAPC|nr:hypothetical protein BpHYR1_008652 [Brachionus plicatilis]